MENECMYPQVATDKPEPDSDDDAGSAAAFKMGSMVVVTLPLCEKRLLLGTKAEEPPPYDQSNRIEGL
jgi:hypothetical protein